MDLTGGRLAETIRDAQPADAEQLVELIAGLGFAIDASGARDRIAKLARNDEPLLVAEIDQRIVAVLDWHLMHTIHRPSPVGRIAMLVVGPDRRGRGIGQALVAEALRRMGQAGCELVEVTSNDRLTEAHAFYRQLGFERTSQRFAKTL